MDIYMQTRPDYTARLVASLALRRSAMIFLMIGCDKMLPVLTYYSLQEV